MISLMIGVCVFNATLNEAEKRQKEHFWFEFEKMQGKRMK